MPFTVSADASGPAAPKPAPALHVDRRGRLAAPADLIRLIWLVADLTPLPCALWVAVSLGQGLLVPAQLGLTKALIDALAAQRSGHGGQVTFLWLGLLVAVLLLERALGGVAPWLQAITREGAGAALQERVMRRAAACDLAAFEHQGYYDQLHQVLADADTRGPQLLQQALQLVQMTPTLFGYAVALATLSPLLVVVIMAVKLPLAVAYGSSGQRNWTLLSGQTRERRLAEYYASLLLGREFAKEVRLYGLAGYLLERWAGLFRQARDAQRRYAMKQGIALRAGGAVSEGAIMLVLWWVITAGLLRGASPGSFALLFQSIGGLIALSFRLSGAVRALGEQSGYASAFRAFLQPEAAGQGAGDQVSEAGDRLDGNGMRASVAPNLEDRTDDVLSPCPTPDSVAPDLQPLVPGPRPPAPGAPAIAFEDVWFTYPGGARPALPGVSFRLAAGEKVALVGENGAGKTTIVKLLLNLYQPDAGRVTLDGVDLRAIPPDALRATMSAAFQQFVRYPLTLAQNVGIAQPDRLEDRAGLAEAVAQAGAADMVARLPSGYATLLGPDVGGVDLSGGQWQRLALARAFFREARVLVLDEPTAALDPLAELAIFGRFLQLVHGRTALLISHRLGMARIADRVLVLAQGRLVEAGHHDELMRVGGEYAALFAAQARWYV